MATPVTVNWLVVTYFLAPSDHFELSIKTTSASPHLSHHHWLMGTRIVPDTSHLMLPCWSHNYLSFVTSALVILWSSCEQKIWTILSDPEGHCNSHWLDQLLQAAWISLSHLCKKKCTISRKTNQFKQNLKCDLVSTLLGMSEINIWKCHTQTQCG